MRKTIYAALLALLGVSVQAGEATFDFSSDPTATLNIGGNNPQPWVETGGNPGGFMAITWPTGSQTTGMVFPDIDDGGIITAFKFEADLRVGNSTGDRAADGFSISIARANDPLFEDPGNQGLFAGGIMEGGSTTGIAISFDTWSGNTYSDGGDIEGILVRVDDKTVLRHAVPTRHGACDDATSLQTGPRDAQYWADGGDFLEPASWEGLCWQPLVVELNDSAQLTVIWKGTTILDNFQTDFFPSAGRLVLAGRTGGANEHTHIDNITLTTSASGDDTTAPTNPGNVAAASVGARFATITWDAATDDSGRVGYEVEVDGGTPQLVNATEFTNTGLNPGTTYAYRVRAIDISGNSSDWQSVSATTGDEQEVVGFLLGEIYDDIPGVAVEDVLFSDGYFDGVVSRGAYMSILGFTTGFGDNYGIVIKGVLTAPETGQFDFFVRSDDASQFFLNESGAAAPDPVLDLWIAEETGCCNPFQEPGAVQTTQAPISLTAGREYGFVFVVKEGGGGDFGQVAMRKVGDPTPAAQLAPISGEILKGIGDPTGADVAISEQPANTFGEEGSFATISVGADVTSPYGVGAYYQWSKDGTPITGGTRDTLVLRNLTTADAGSYSVKVGTMGKTVESNAVTLTVVPPGELPSVGGSGSVDVRVSSGADDAEEHLTEGNSIDLTSSDLELGAEGGGADAQLKGILFRNISIPAGATITSATIQFTVDEADDEPTSLMIYGELSPEAVAYTDAVGDISARPRTTAVVEWNDIPEWDGASVGTAGPDQLTPDLASIVQEIIAQDGWNGNSMAFLIEGTENSERTVESFDGDANAAPLLHIEYTSGDGGGGGGFNTDGLVAHWSFDGDLTDSVGSLDGTARGSVGFEGSQAGFGQAISLDGSAFVEIENSAAALEFPGANISISGWFTVGAFDKNWQALIAKGEGTNYRVARRSGENSIAYAGGIGEGANDAPDVNDGGWHHFVAVSDANGIEFGTALYVDGMLYEINAGLPNLDSDTTNLYIGENPEALNRQWIGLIDDISIWSRILSASEVSELYNGGAGTPISSLVGGGGGGFTLGLNFGADEPDGAGAFTLAASDTAGVPGVSQSNWNNLSGAEGLGTGLVDGSGASTAVLVEWVSNGSWASTGRSEGNGDGFGGGAGPDFNLMGGYLDTGDPTTTTVAISGIDAGVASAGYDVYVYANGGVAAGRAGGYRIVDATSGDAITDYVLATSATSPTDYAQVPTDLAAGVHGEGTYIVFGGITARNIILEATTDNGLGAGSPARAPVNAVQIVGSGGGGGDDGSAISIARSATGVTVTFEGTLQSSDSVAGPYTDVAGATSPADIPLSGSARFFRSQQ